MFGACETPAVTLSSGQPARPLLDQFHRGGREPLQCLSLSLLAYIRKDVSEMKKSVLCNWPRQPAFLLATGLTDSSASIQHSSVFCT